MTELFLDIVVSIIVLTAYWSHQYDPTVKPKSKARPKSIASTVKAIAVPEPSVPKLSDELSDEQVSLAIADLLIAKSIDSIGTAIESIDEQDQESEEELSEESYQRLADVLVGNYINHLMDEPVDRPVKVIELRRIAPSLGITNSSRMKRLQLHDRVLQAMLDRDLTEYRDVRVTPLGLRVVC